MNPPSIAEQIQVLEEAIQSLRDSHADAEGRIDDEKALRDIENLSATLALLKRWTE